MTAITRIFVFSAIMALILSACNWGTTTPTVNGEPVILATGTPPPPLTMAVNYQIVDQTINYSYLIANTGGVPAPGPMVITDDKVQVICPDITTVGNNDNYLDANETLTCSGSYTITQADIDAGSVSTLSTASASGYVSAGIATNVPISQPPSLTLTKSPDSQTFNSVGQAIIYSFVITNTSNVNIGPAQFTIVDDKIGASLPCGSGDTTIPPGGTINCSATYLTTQDDLTTGSITNTAYATDGTTNSAPVVVTVTRGGVDNQTDYTVGETISHQVVRGEWLWQIARCYGADPKQVISDNPMSDYTKLKLDTTVTVRNIGSKGTIYGDPCVHIHRVESGETWASIAGQYSDIDVDLLVKANPGGLAPGTDVKVPVGPLQYP